MRRHALSVILLLTASTALALTIEEVQADADALFADYEILEADVAACPDGDCPEAQEILDSQDALDARQVELHDDREAFGSCACLTLDATISDVDDLAEYLRVATGDWFED